MKVIGLIPTRLNSTRLPQKALLKIKTIKNFFMPLAKIKKQKVL